MLLVIVLGNAHVFLYGHKIGVRRYPIFEEVPDQVLALFQMTFVDGRGYPMFAALFGYGLVQLARRQARLGLEPRAVRRILRRRGCGLVLLGFAHALFLFSGDIIGAYGMLAVLLTGVVVGASDRALLLIAGIWMIPAAFYGALQGIPVPEHAPPLESSISTSAPLKAAGFRVEEWGKQSPVQVSFSLISPMLIGAWAGRRRLLDEPERYQRCLRGVAVLGVGAAVAGGLPMALMASEVWTEPTPVANIVAGVLHAVTGYAGGVGYAALAGLIAIRLSVRQGPVVRAMKACGQRSMTCYLGQSVLLVAVLPAYGGGLGDHLGVAEAAVLAVLIWCVVVAMADIMRRLSVRGPAEVLLRRVTYGRASAAKH
ncbi:DUF418 domain-containing protein [Saccharopolyspora phatthalungensis]|uniref:Putative membrane protein YeiB n=1 Tax=Saccharopolyspora phatthalungensis TaxID=664693 RepID=A0A840QAN2_9PSEU|nr:DUF418 domain-containing protein [Saccharopolyspora phatthalungensis]MBB5157007.1 putative membrane protein YeiB [Saccharopolyspora phatthalungensis]